MTEFIEVIAAHLYRVIDRVARVEARIPHVILAVLFTVTGLAGWRVYRAGITLDFTVDSLFATETEAEDDPLRVYADFSKQFGSNDNMVLVALRLDRVFTPESMRVLYDLTHEFTDTRAHPEFRYVRRVFSIRNTIFPFAKEEGALLKRELNQEQCNTLRQLTEGNTFYVNTLVSRDEHVASLLLDIDNTGVDASRWPTVRGELIKAVYRVLEDNSRRFQDDQRRAGVTEPVPLEYHLSGIPLVENRYVDLLWEDLSFFTGLTVLLAAVILLLYFRSPAGMLLPLGVILMALTWLLAAMTLLGWSMSLTSTILPSLLMIIGIADSVHIISHYHAEIRRGRERREAIIETTKELGVACFLTSFTTAVGFLSLTVVKVQVVWQFGVLAAMGVGFAYIASVTFVPAMLNVIGARRASAQPPSDLSVLDQLILSVGRVARGHKGKVMAVTAGVLVLAGLGIRGYQPLMDFAGVEIRSSWFQDLHESDPLLQDNRWVEDNLTGIFSLEIDVQGNRPGVMREPETIERIDALQDMLIAMKVEGKPGPVTKTFSIVDLQNEIKKRRITSALMPSNAPPVDEVMDALSVASRSKREQFREVVQRYQYEVFRLLLEELPDGTRLYEHMDELVELINGGFTQAPGWSRVATHIIGTDPETGIPIRVFDYLQGLYSGAQVPFGRLAQVVPVGKWPDLLLGYRFLLNIDTGAFNQERFLMDELLNKEVLGTLVNDDYTRTRVTVLMKDIDSKKLGNMMEQLEAWNLANFEAMPDELQKVTKKSTRFFTKDTTVRMTGKSVLGKKALDMVIINMLTSIIGAMGIIFVLLMILLRSLRFALISLVPNILPLVITLATMGYLSIPLNFSTIMVFSIALGIAVDDTIHFLSRYRLEIRVDGDHLWAVLRTLESTGRAIVFTSFLLCVGFGVLLFSNFRFTFNFGILGVVTMASACVADLFLLPVLLLIAKPKP